MEIIEIGAVELASSTGPAGREFGAFVKPITSQELSDFCKQLTSIRQEEVTTAEMFPAVFVLFLQWIGVEPFVLCSWGAYDLNQFRRDCNLHRLQLPATFENHVNLKQEFARQRGLRPMGMKRALGRSGIPLRGTHHRGMDDARNIAALAQIILPQRSPET